MSRHTLSVLSENKPGVLARVAGLFSRRGFNIVSLAVGETDDGEHRLRARAQVRLHLDPAWLEADERERDRATEHSPTVRTKV